MRIRERDSHCIDFDAVSNAIPAFVRGEWSEIDSQTLGDLMEFAVESHSASFPDGKFPHKKSASVDLNSWGSQSNLIDAIMFFSYPAEPINVSLSRLASAVCFLGFDKITPYSSGVAYRKFHRLSQEYKKCQKKNQ